MTSRPSTGNVAQQHQAREPPPTQAAPSIVSEIAADGDGRASESRRTRRDAGSCRSMPPRSTPPAAARAPSSVSDQPA